MSMKCKNCGKVSWTSSHRCNPEDVRIHRGQQRFDSSSSMDVNVYITPSSSSDDSYRGGGGSFGGGGSSGSWGSDSGGSDGGGGGGGGD